MGGRAQLLVELPEEKEIESSAEEKIPSHGLIKKTIRYRNGLVAVVVQDFQESVFSVKISSAKNPFWKHHNRLFQVG